MGPSWEFDGYADRYVLRKYVDPEPSHGSWGSEEEPLVVYLTIYLNDGGILRMNNVSRSNGTVFAWGWGFTLEYELIAVVEGNLTFGFNNFTWDGSYNCSNPYNFSFAINNNVTLWCYFEPITVGNGVTSVGIEQKFVGLMFLGFFIALPIIIILKKKGI